MVKSQWSILLTPIWKLSIPTIVPDFQKSRQHQTGRHHLSRVPTRWNRPESRRPCRPHNSTPKPTTPQQQRSALHSQFSPPSLHRPPALAQCNLQLLLACALLLKLKETIIQSPSRPPSQFSRSSNVSCVARPRNSPPLFHRRPLPFRQTAPPPLPTFPSRSVPQLSLIRPIVIFPWWTRPIVWWDQRSCVLKKASVASEVSEIPEADLRWWWCLSSLNNNNNNNNNNSLQTSVNSQTVLPISTTWWCLSAAPRPPEVTISNVSWTITLNITSGLQVAKDQLIWLTSRPLSSRPRLSDHPDLHPGSFSEDCARSRINSFYIWSKLLNFLELW